MPQTSSANVGAPIIVDLCNLAAASSFEDENLLASKEGSTDKLIDKLSETLGKSSKKKLATDHKPTEESYKSDEWAKYRIISVLG